ncbi:MAG: AAA family ATPase [Longimicrobiales bacterium]|nr:AAA family ATPase [Longimicrobiales bacterium]
MAKTLVFLVGPPAVGKMTVGRELSRITGLPLFHNHLSIEAVLPVFDFGHPAFNRLVAALRRGVIEEVAQSELPGVIFTYVWAFDAPEDQAYVEALGAVFREGGGRVVYAELWADQETRLRRNATPSRIESKPSKRDVEASNRRLVRHDQEHRLSSKGGDFPLEPHLFLDNTERSPREAAERIAHHFGLPEVAKEA